MDPCPYRPLTPLYTHTGCPLTTSTAARHDLMLIWLILAGPRLRGAKADSMATAGSSGPEWLPGMANQDSLLSGNWPRGQV